MPDRSAGRLASRQSAVVCPPKPPLQGRPLLSGAQAEHLQALFKMLANDTRLRLLHALVRAGELCVTDLAQAIGMTPQAVSNQLQRLVDRGILIARRNGSSVHYRILDPCVPSLLDTALCLSDDAEAAGAETTRPRGRAR